MNNSMAGKDVFPLILTGKWLIAVILAVDLFGSGLLRAGGSTSVGSPSNPGALFGAIMTAYNAGYTTITINPGTYAIPMATGGAYTWNFQNMSNVTLSAPNVTIVFADPSANMILFNHCTNFTFSGATITSAIPCFAQGAMFNQGTDANGPYVDVQLDAGYPSDWSTTAHWGSDIVNGVAYAPTSVFGATTGRYKPGMGDYYAIIPPTTLSAPNRQYRFHFYGFGSDFLPAAHLAVNGDKLVFLGTRGGAVYICNNCSNLTWNNITDTVGYAAWWECGNGLVTISNSTFTYQPPPSGGTVTALEGPTGVLSLGNSVGLHMTNTTWNGSSDDVINSDIVTGHVGQINGTTLTFTDPDATLYAVGDIVYLYDTNGNYLGADTVASVPTLLTSYTPPDNTYGTVSWYSCALSQPVSVSYKYSVVNTNHNGSGFTVTNSTIRNFRDVGLIVGTLNPYLAGNTLDGATVGAVVMDGLSTNGVVANNVIENGGFAEANINNGRNCAALEITNQIYDPGTTGSTFSNLLVQNNTFSGNYGINIALANVSGAQILNNTLENTHQAIPNVTTYPTGIVNYQDAGAEIWLADDTNVVLLGNVVSNAGSYETHVTETSNPMTNTFGATSGTWQDLDINTGLAGSVSTSGNSITIQGGGADIWGTSDGFNFSYLPLTGNGTLIARVVSMANTTDTDPFAKAGIMVRQNLTSTSPFAFLSAGNQALSWFIDRTTTGAGAGIVGSVSQGPPIWLKLVRSGTSMYGFYSSTGDSWTAFSGSPITIASMSGPVYIGMAVSAHNNNLLNTATFDNVSLGVLPTSEQTGLAWKYTTSMPAGNWYQPTFDDSAWSSGLAGFGTLSYERTLWTTDDIWIRKHVTISGTAPTTLTFRTFYDEGSTYYINGVLAATTSGFTTGYVNVPINSAGSAAWVNGDNVIAVHTIQTSGGQYIDLGLLSNF